MHHEVSTSGVQTAGTAQQKGIESGLKPPSVTCDGAQHNCCAGRPAACTAVARVVWRTEQKKLEVSHTGASFLRPQQPIKRHQLHVHTRCISAYLIQFALLSVLVCTGLSASIAPGATAFSTFEASGWRSVTVGANHACATTAAFELVCFGDNSHGQTDIPSGVFPEPVVASGNFTCGLRSGSLGRVEVVCWGSHTTASLNAGQDGSSDPIVYTKLVAGDDFVCASHDVPNPDDSNAALGALDCWSAIPGHPVLDIPFSGSPPAGIRRHGFRSLSAGPAHMCATLNRLLTCWGDDSFGQASPPFFEATTIAETKVRITTAPTYSCIFSLDIGLRRCWGEVPPRLASSTPLHTHAHPFAQNVSVTAAVTAASVDRATGSLCVLVAGTREGTVHGAWLPTADAAINAAAAPHCLAANRSTAALPALDVHSASPNLEEVSALTVSFASIASGGGHVCLISAAGGLTCFAPHGRLPLQVPVPPSIQPCSGRYLNPPSNVVLEACFDAVSYSFLGVSIQAVYVTAFLEAFSTRSLDLAGHNISYLHPETFGMLPAATNLSLGGNPGIAGGGFTAACAPLMRRLPLGTHRREMLPAAWNATLGPHAVSETLADFCGAPALVSNQTSTNGPSLGGGCSRLTSHVQWAGEAKSPIKAIVLICSWKFPLHLQAVPPCRGSRQTLQGYSRMRRLSSMISAVH